MAVKRYNGSGWDTVAGVGAQGAAATSSSIVTWVKTASGGETSLSGNDDNSQPLSYTAGQELVYINGVLQKRNVDYVATTGTTITGLNALAASDVVTVWTVNAFSVTNAIPNSTITAKGDLIVGTSSGTYTAQAVGTDGQVLTADSTQADGVKWVTPTYVGVSAYKSAAQSISNLTATAITFNTEDFDTNGFHDNSTNTSRFTVPSGKAGKYLVTGNVNYLAGSVTGPRGAYIYKNGSVYNYQAQNAAVSPSPYGAIVKVSFVLNLAVSDYIEIFAFQGDGGSLNISENQSGTNVQITYLGA